MRQISIAIFAALFSISAVTYGQINEQMPNAEHISATRLINGGATFLPSPFTGNVGNLPASAADVAASGDGMLAPAAKTNSKKIVIEVRTLNVNLETASTILNVVDAKNLSHSSGAIKPTWQPINEGSGSSKEHASGQTATLQSHPISYAQISDDQYSEIVSLIKSNSRSQVTQAPTVMTYENEPATVSDAASVPFVVAVKPVVDETRVTQQPEIQLIEEGTIYEFIASATEGGVQLKTHMISNQITAVDTFTFDGSGNDNGVTIQLPTCRCTQIHLANEIKKGHSMLVDTNIVREGEIRKETGVLNRIVGNTRPEKYKTKTMLIIRTSIVDE